jgi:hypothetical protein
MRINKIFCGSGKQKTSTWLKVTINPDKLMEYVQEYEGRRFVKLDINLLNEPNQFGKDIEVTIDTWKPDDKKGYKTRPNTDSEYKEAVNNDDLPF